MNSSQYKFKTEDLGVLLKNTSGRIFIPRIGTGDLKSDINEPERQFVINKEKLMVYLFLYPETKNLELWNKLISLSLIDISIEYENGTTNLDKQKEVKNNQKKKKNRQKQKKIEKKNSLKKTKNINSLKKTIKSSDLLRLSLQQFQQKKNIGTKKAQENNFNEGEEITIQEKGNGKGNGKDQNKIKVIGYSEETKFWSISKKGIALLKMVPVELMEEIEKKKNNVKIQIKILTNKQSLREISHTKEISKIRELKTFGYDPDINIDELLNRQISQTLLIEKSFETTLPILKVIKYNTQYHPLGQTTYLHITVENILKENGIYITDLEFPLSATRCLISESAFVDNRNFLPNKENNLDFQLKLDEKYLVTNLSGPQLKKRPIKLLYEESTTLLLKIEKKVHNKTQKYTNKTITNQNQTQKKNTNDDENNFEEFSNLFCTTAIFSMKIPFINENLKIDIPVEWVRLRESKFQIRIITDKRYMLNKQSKLKIEIHNFSQQNYKLQLNVPLEQRTLIQSIKKSNTSKREELGYVGTPILCSEAIQIIKLKAQRSKSLFLHFVPFQEGLLNFNFWFLELNSNQEFYPDEKCVIYVNDQKF
ncbi:hypothetical protein M0813_11261 [Anaeramoeba flamelloides]|uniref:Uncharacterized protein n=1 Tax=Anaeramoeba flamelloides TaxID=1746091 RepID=A0ABQ8ZFZ6_9EUKA|nr:hypothetical protein M0813_11261 [Anaeramoeba flamelloides]